MTSYNGNDITYDEIGNPLTYNGYNYTWERGRELASLSGNGLDESYMYNSNGIRTQKTVNGVTTTYHLVGNNVTFEDNGTDSIYYTYDPNGKLVSMNLNGTEYFYVRNAQGDIISLVDKYGAYVASYVYDTWGKLVSIKDGNGNDVTNVTTSVGYKNPYRYRGYRYDTETGLYYCNSRYYNPDWGRFINADALAGKVGQLLSHNMFAYCMNNPVNMTDPSGHMPTWAKVVIGTVVVVAVVATIVVAPEVVLAAAAEGGELIASATAGVTAIANKFGNLQCTDAAEKIKQYLINLGEGGIQISIKYQRAFIWSNTADEVISENGFHTGILYDGKVYDNIHKAGVTLEEWLADFEGVGERVVTQSEF